MPSGHTDKRTMTRYRADLLRSLPLEMRRLRNPKRHQLGNCISYGWAVARDKLIHLTEAGKKAVEDFGPYWSIPWSYTRDG